MGILETLIYVMSLEGALGVCQSSSPRCIYYVGIGVDK